MNAEFRYVFQCCRCHEKREFSKEVGGADVLVVRRYKFKHCAGYGLNSTEGWVCKECWKSSPIKREPSQIVDLAITT